MKQLTGLLVLLITYSGCNKDNSTSITCDIQKAYTENAKKVTIPAGVWGTVASMEGNCMPIIDPSLSSCKTCPVKRTVKIFEYTLAANATPAVNSPVFFESFSTRLITSVETDDNGFFQINIPNGHYTIAIVENGKLYANGTDGQGGLSPFQVLNGTEKVNVTMTYKATF